MLEEFETVFPQEEVKEEPNDKAIRDLMEGLAKPAPATDSNRRVQF